MIYSDKKITHSFNVIYKAEEYTSRFGLLVTAMSDPFDKTILAGMSIRESPIQNKLRVDMGVFDYGKYIVQMNTWVDLDMPDLSKKLVEAATPSSDKPGDLNKDDNVYDSIKIVPAFSFRFLPEEESKDITVVENMYLEYIDQSNVLNHTKYNLRNENIAVTIGADTPSVIMKFNQTKIIISGYNNVDYSDIKDKIDSARIISTDTIKASIDDPNYKRNNRMEIILNDYNYKLIKFNVDQKGNVKFTNSNSNYCYSLENSNKFIRIFYRRLLHIDEKGLSLSKSLSRSIKKTYIHDESDFEEKTLRSYSDNNNTVHVTKNSGIKFISDVETTIDSYSPDYVQQYRWIELYTNDVITCRKLMNVVVVSYQVYGSVFDESYFGMSFSYDNGVNWLYINTMNDSLVIRTISFDPVLVTPFSSDLLYKLFNDGLINKNDQDDKNKGYYEVIDKDFGYPTYGDYFNDNNGDSDLYTETLNKLNSLNNSDYLVNVATGDYLNHMIAAANPDVKDCIYKIAVTFKYHHDDNLIHFYVKDVTELDSLDCIVGLLETVDGKSFEVQYRDQVYQRMIPYAEWCDSLPEDIIHNTQLINSRLKDISDNKKVSRTLDIDLSEATGVSNDVTDSNNTLGKQTSLATYETGLPNVVMGNYNTIYTFSKMKKPIAKESIETSIRLYSSTFVQTQMLLYDYTYSLIKLVDSRKIITSEIQTTGLIYDNINVLKKNQYINFKVNLPNDTERFMIIPLTSSTIESNYWLIINNERYAPFLELDTQQRNIDELNITIKALVDDLLVYGVGIIYDTTSNSMNKVRLNNRHNLNVPYFDSTNIKYETLKQHQVEHRNTISFNLSYIIHSDLPNDDTYVDVYVYDKFIQRFYELSKIDEDIIINASMIRFEDLYKRKNYYSVPITLKATNKYGSTTVNKELLIETKSSYNIKIVDFKYVFLNKNVDDKNTEDTDDDVTYYNYMVLLYIDSAGRNDVIYEFMFDKNKPLEGVYKGLVTNDIISISLTLKEDELPRTTYLKVYTIDKKYKVDRTLTIKK